MSGGFNSFGFNTSPPNSGGGTFVSTRTHAPDQPFILQLRDKDGVMLAKIEGFTGGQWTSRANSADSLSFTIPMQSPLAQSGDLVYPNRIWICDSTAQTLQQCVITRTVEDSRSEVFTVECLGLMYMLDHEFIPKDTSDLGQKTVQDLVIAMLAFQENTNPVTIGNIAPEFRDQTLVINPKADMSIIDGIMKIWDSFGGVLSIDSSGRLNWVSESTDHTKPVLTAYTDLESYTKTIDTDTVFNKIYVKGIIYNDSGNHSRKNVTVQDAVSQGIYGIRAKSINAKMGSPEAIGNLANRLLAYYKDPQAVRAVNLIDYSRIQLDPDLNQDKKQEYLYPGAKIKVIPPSNMPSDSAFDAVILEVSRNLNDSLAAAVTIGDVNPGNAQFQTNKTEEFFTDLAKEFKELDFMQDQYQEQDEDLWEAIEEIGEAGDDIQPISSENSEGDNEGKFARDDHVHKGVVLWDPEDATATPPVPAPSDSTDLPTVAENPNDAPTVIAVAEIASGDDEGLWVYQPRDDEWTPWNFWA